jgi:tetratricopeptide (TPR) repeat protein
LRTSDPSWPSLSCAAPLATTTPPPPCSEIDFGYLRVWGHYRTLVDMHERVHGQISDPSLNAVHLKNLGYLYIILGDYRLAIDLYAQALTISRDIGRPSRRARHPGRPGELLLKSG